jgi:hypothetical protein
MFRQPGVCSSYRLKMLMAFCQCAGMAQPTKRLHKMQ